MSDAALVRMCNGRCAQVNLAGGDGIAGPAGPAGPAAPSTTPLTISASVGVGATNNREDVRTIQGALNRIPAEQGGAVPRLEVDGWIGADTTAAIRRFQTTQFGWADGKVDPNQKTLARLNELLRSFSGGNFGQQWTEAARVTSPVLRRVKAEVAIPYVKCCVRAALANIAAAAGVVAIDYAPNKTQIMHLTRLHFGIALYTDQQAVSELIRLTTIYRTMGDVLNSPGGPWGPIYLDWDPVPSEHPTSFAWTTGGGIAKPGFKGSGLHRSKTIRNDRIYLCEYLDYATDDCVVVTLLHELAHFVSTEVGERHISDHAYGQVDSFDMAALQPRQRLTNAETFANFAFEAYFKRRSFQPQIVVPQSR